MLNAITQRPLTLKAHEPHISQKHPPLEQITSPTVSTNSAAYYLNRRPQTLRAWACLENGPIRPVRINGRLAWNVAGIRALLAGCDNHE